MIDHDVGVSMTGIYNVKEVSNDFFEEDSIQNGPLLVHAERFKVNVPTGIQFRPALCPLASSSDLYTGRHQIKQLYFLRSMYSCTWTRDVAADSVYCSNRAQGSSH